MPVIAKQTFFFFLRLREERQRSIEEVLAELKEVLKEVQEWREVAEERDSREGDLRARLRNQFREALAKAVASTKQELVQVCHVTRFSVL